MRLKPRLKNFNQNLILTCHICICTYRVYIHCSTSSSFSNNPCVLNCRHYIGSVNRLKALRIWRESSGGTTNRLEMNAIFRSNLKIALCGGQVKNAKLLCEKNYHQGCAQRKAIFMLWTCEIQGAQQRIKPEEILGFSQKYSTKNLTFPSHSRANKE